jgi:energy-converting hydrogenase B subunit D
VIVKDVVSDTLPGLAVVIVLGASVGVLVMRDAYSKLHFVTPAALVAPALVALAVAVQAGLFENTGESLLALLFMIIAGPFLSRATIRAIRVREKGDWRPDRRQHTSRGGGTMIVAVNTRYTVPIGFMNGLQITILVLVAAGATAVVLIRRPVHQVLVLSVYGVLLAVLFLAFQAPDVTLSELTVGAVVLPIILLLTLAKVRKREE